MGVWALGFRGLGFRAFGARGLGVWGLGFPYYYIFSYNCNCEKASRLFRPHSCSWDPFKVSWLDSWDHIQDDGNGL